MGELRIEDATEAIIDYRGKTPPKSNTGIKLLTAKVIKDGTINETRLEYVSEDTYSWWMRRGFPQRGDILITTEAPLGEVAMLCTDEPVALAQRVILLRANPSVMDPTYLFAALRSPLVHARLLARATGTTVTGIKQRELREVLIPAPQLAVQHKIASILAAYDDLIENNTRRIHVLEEMAQAIYREWFVEFRFPGHEDVPMVDSELGPIPEGWRLEAFSALGEYVNGHAFRPSDWGDEGLPIVKIRELKEGVTGDTPRYPAGQLPDKYLVSDGDVLFSWSADLDAYIWAGGDAWLNQHLFRVDPHPDLSRLYLFHALRDRMGEFRSRALGTTMRHIKRSALDQVQAVVPVSPVLTAFDSIVTPIDALRLNLISSNEVLRQTRDLLLPRLISGEIDVSDLDIGDAEPAA